MSKTRLATVWLDGCSGCHMSLLDMDERLIELADRIELVYGPLVDLKSFPSEVDVTLVEGAVTTDHDVELLTTIRANTTVLVALGDCAVTGNILAMRDVLPLNDVMHRLYFDNASLLKRVPERDLPKFLKRIRPVHEIVNVDVHIPGCPPSADTIFRAISELLEGRVPEMSMTARFGA